jgi:hypothetical protein
VLDGQSWHEKERRHEPFEADTSLDVTNTYGQSKVSKKGSQINMLKKEQ